MTWPSVVLASYLMVLGLLSLNGLHRLALLAWSSRPSPDPVPPTPTEWPPVTVQLPLFNERFVVERLIRATAALDYPRDRLQIQVLDDSTDDTTDLARREVDRLRAEGLDIALLHRVDRVGFKAGALDAGSKVATGDLIAVFDADFVPQSAFLRLVVPWLTPGVGMAQARWGHLNATDSWLTAAQATLLDGHFVIEHAARHRAGRWFNFNGTAGVWRREAIEAAGGWQHDTLTEDLDLSYRAQLAGWRFVYLVDVVVPAELPPDMAAFKAQQHRWAKGSVQTARKLLARIWRSEAPLATKLEATTHLTANFSYPLVVLLSVMLPWAVLARLEGAARALVWVDLVLFALALFPFVTFYAAAIRRAGPSPGPRLRRLPVVLALGLGLAVAQSRAVWEGLSSSVGTFVRTPKWGGASRAAGYKASTRGLVRWELALAAYLSLACVYVVSQGYFASLPFLALFACGYGAVGLGSLRS